jgi:hypothetical protein
MATPADTAKNTAGPTRTSLIARTETPQTTSAPSRRLPAIHPLATSRCSSDNFYYRLSLCGDQLLDLFGELDDEAPPDRRPALFSPGSIGP